MKKVLAAIFAIGLASALVFAQAGVVKSGNFAYKYDVTGSTTTYCVTTGVNGDVFGSFIRGPGTVETSGSSVTVTGVNAADDVFTDVDVGDMFQVRFPNGTFENRVVVTNADADTITVDTAIDLSAGYVWYYKSLACGTGVLNGWVDVSDARTVSLTMQYDAGDMDDLDVVWECKEGAVGSEPVQVYPGPASDCGFGTLATNVCQFATVGDRLTVVIADNTFAECRIGVAVTTDGATIDEVTMTVSIGQ